MEVRVNGVTEMGRFATSLVEKLQRQEEGATIVALSGELGAGKTTFAQAAAKALGVEETVNSPTFVIEKIYALQNSPPAGGWQRLVHIDAYRLNKADELRSLGWTELAADPGNLILIEWPEHVGSAIPKDAHRISIEIGEGESRTIRLPRLELGT